MDHLLGHFPKLTKANSRITSPKDFDYNCIAWAAQETEQWWWPDRQNNYYWPDNVPRQETLDAFMKAFQLLGYKPCDGGELEEEYEKVAIYLSEAGKPTHMSRQLDSGRWTSKLGESEDIEHEIKGVESDSYGTIKQYLKRVCRS